MHQQPPDTPAAPAEVLDLVGDWLARGRPVALASVVATFGSAPRPLGSLLAVTADGDFAGSVSGGCVEGAVIEAARELLAAGAGRRELEFGVSDQRAWSLGLSCGGTIRLHLEVADAATLGPALAAGRARLPMVRVLEPASGASALLGPEAGIDQVGATFGPAAAQAAAAALAADRSQAQDVGGRTLLFQMLSPPRRLLIVGAGHIAQHLAPLGLATGFRVTVIDPRGAFATEQRFPGITLDRRWPGEALADPPLDRHCAVVTLSHDPKLDDPALAAALDSEAFYVGALGSRRTHAARAGRLGELGYGEAQIARIHGPVGLDLGGREPAEIALAAMAEIVQVRHRGVARG